MRKRRFAEAQVFGLYDDPSNVSPEEARSVAQMHGLHRDEIDRVERAHGVSIGGDQGKRDRIAEANRDYPAIVREYGSIQNIAESLEPARLVLLRQVREENPPLAASLSPESFSADRIHLDPNRDLRDAASVDQDLAAIRPQRKSPRAAAIKAIDREQRNSTTEDVDVDHAATIDSQRMSRGMKEIASNDLLVGQGGDDTLRSHRGNDILIGGQGHDRMEGGKGYDTYVIGAGDAVMDSDGLGEVYWGGQRLTGGRQTESDPVHSYRSDDGRFIYSMEGNNLSVSDALATDRALGERAVIENFQSGQLGITLAGPNDQERLTSRQPGRAPFNDPYLDRTYAALRVGDSNQLDRIAIEFAQSPEGQRMAQLGDQLLAQKQALEQQQLQEQQMALTRRGPGMSL